MSGLVVGTGTIEDLELRRYDIIENVIASLGETFKLQFVGRPGQHKAIKYWFQRKTNISTAQLTVRNYCTQHEQFRDMLKL